MKDLETRWNNLICENFGDNRWEIWKKQITKENKHGTVKTFFAYSGKEIIGEATLRFENLEINGLRVNKEYQGQGIASGLIEFIEHWAKKQNIDHLIIGVEPCEIRNMQIYFKWGFSEFVSHKFETYPPQNENQKSETILVLYYKKKLRD